MRGAVSDDGKLEEKEYNLAVVKEIARRLLNKVVLRYIVREQRIVQFPKRRGYGLPINGRQTC